MQWRLLIIARKGMGMEGKSVRILCPRIIFSREPGLQWLIGSPFMPFTVVSSFRCIHTHGDPFSSDYAAEADDMRTLLLRGFDIIGALVIGDGDPLENASKAANAACNMTKWLNRDHENAGVIGAAYDLNNGKVQYFFFGSGSDTKPEAFDSVLCEENPEKYLWERGCLLRCELSIRLPVYLPTNRPSADVEGLFTSLIDETTARFNTPQMTYVVEGAKQTLEECQPIVLCTESDIMSGYSNLKPIKGFDGADNLFCSYFSSSNQLLSTAREITDPIKVTVFLNCSRNTPPSCAPTADYFPVMEPTRLVHASFNLDALCYSSKDFPVTSAVSLLVVPALIDQLTTMKTAILPCLMARQPQLCPNHFLPPGILHPVTALYELSYGETEMKLVEIRRLLHSRLGLPLDRPLLRVANSLNFFLESRTGKNGLTKGSARLKDVHTGIPSSGVVGGQMSLVDGSYEYYHYLQDGFDDNGWGCAYRSLQTIFSWFRLQHYTSIEVPSHRKIQETLVEIGDKEISFVGSREWIGAIELSFVLDSLLGVSCKIINVRSGSELPEKCRELALHFHTQGTPVMIGGGVLAYTLLGVDYNEHTGDCAFLILDPHYTGGEDLKSIVNGGWCGWKKATDSRGKSFFLRDKFYNLLCLQRPNMV
ncbi:probable Ufm1-specific protease isoform X1 [Amborella trichopoda]|nr:probable Ufm1-specific protease isoform X1 [Amborella trichopoda]|eukprot:XP_006852259.2 probable Ufm1-specific protease isoform X1 [Amborella trichopoda]